MFQIEIVDFVIKNPGINLYNSLEEELKSKNSSKIENESSKIVEEIFSDFVINSEKIGWSYAYTQFSPGQFKYHLKKDD